MNSFYIFAHNGVIHTSNGEATAHVMTDILRLLAVILIGVVITWAIVKTTRKFSYIKIRVKNRRGDR